MGNLLNKNIDQTYQGLINTVDEAPIGVTPKALTDGAGNVLPVEVGTNGMVYSGTQDFTGATVTGISASASVVGPYNTSRPTLSISSQRVYRFSVPFIGNTGSANTINNGSLTLVPVSIGGGTLNDMSFRVTAQGAPGTTISVGVYANTLDVNGHYRPGELLFTAATGIAGDTAGKKDVLGINQTYGPTVDGLYWFGFLPLGGALGFQAGGNAGPVAYFGNFENLLPDRYIAYRVTGLVGLPSDITGLTVSAGAAENILFGIR